MEKKGEWENGKSFLDFLDYLIIYLPTSITASLLIAPHGVHTHAQTDRQSYEYISSVGVCAREKTERNVTPAPPSRMDVGFLRRPGQTQACGHVEEDIDVVVDACSLNTVSGIFASLCVLLVGENMIRWGKTGGVGV